MIDKIVKRGYHSKHRQLITQIEIPVSYGSLSALYIDTNYNAVKPFHIIKNLITKEQLTEVDFHIDRLTEIMRNIDEDAYQKDYICRCLVLVWEDGKGDKLISKGGDGIDIFAIDNGWDELDMEKVCAFPNQSEKWLYTGSGASLPLSLHADKDVSLLIQTEETMFFLNSKTKGGRFDILESYKELLNERKYGEVLDNINYDFMINKSQPSKDLFLAFVH